MNELSLRALNRATLDRELLLRRHVRPARWGIEHLTGLQAQAPLAPYVGLWTRLAGFRHEDLQDLLTERSVVRAHLLRNTIHLLTAEDFVRFRALFQPLRERGPAGAPRPDPDLPAPPRFLPEYDNLLLSFAGRGRVIPDDRPVPLPAGRGATTGTLLVDGFWRADWKITKDPDLAVLRILPFQPVGQAEADAIAAEGRRLLEFAAPAAAQDVRFTRAS